MKKATTEIYGVIFTHKQKTIIFISSPLDIYFAGIFDSMFHLIKTLQ